MAWREPWPEAKGWWYRGSQEGQRWALVFSLKRWLAGLWRGYHRQAGVGAECLSIMYAEKPA